MQPLPLRPARYPRYPVSVARKLVSRRGKAGRRQVGRKFVVARQSSKLRKSRRIAREDAGRCSSCECDRSPRPATRSVSPLGKFRSRSAPRLLDWATATSRSPGLRLGSSHHLPGPSVQWSWMRGTPLTVAGAARALTRVPVLIPLEGNLSRAGKVPERSGGVNCVGPRIAPVIRHDRPQIVAVRPALLFEHRAWVKGGNVSEAEDGDRAGPLG